MSIFKEKKPLIEWEKDYDVWKLDLLPGQHFIECTKLEAFNLFSIGNIKRDWGCYEQEFYRNYISFSRNSTLILFSGIDCTVIDNRKKSFIEWEKELGFFVTNASIYEHNKKCSKSEAEKLLYTSCFVSSWNDDADKLYFDCIYNKKYSSDNCLAIKNFKYVNVVPVEEVNKKDSFIKKIVLGKQKNKKYEFTEKRVKVRGYDNKVKIRGKCLKKVFALALSLMTAFSTTGFSNSAVETYSLNDEKISSSTNLSDSIIKSEKCVKLVNDNVKLDRNSVSKERFDLNKKIVTKEIEFDSVNLGDVINIKDGSKVYDNVYSAIDKDNGLDCIYSFDTDRNVNYVALKYDNNIIYSNDYDEISRYEQCGASVVSVCTDDGFYNYDDIVVKVKKNR